VAGARRLGAPFGHGVVIGVEAHREAAHDVGPGLHERPVAVAVLVRERAIHPPGLALGPVDRPGLRHPGRHVLQRPAIGHQAALLRALDGLRRVVPVNGRAQRVADAQRDLVARHGQVAARPEDLAQEHAVLRVFQAHDLDDAADLDAGDHQGAHLPGGVVRGHARLVDVEIVVVDLAHLAVRRAHPGVEGPEFGPRRPMAAQRALVEAALVQDGHDRVPEPLVVPALAVAHVEAGDLLQQHDGAVIGVIGVGGRLHALQIRPAHGQRGLAAPQREKRQNRQRQSPHGWVLRNTMGDPSALRAAFSSLRNRP
jgi:hypothetical protein